MSQAIKEKLGEDILFVPKDFHVILNATTEQLEAAKSALEVAIEMKKQKENN